MFNLYSYPKCSSVTSFEPRTQFNQCINLAVNEFGNTALLDHSFHEALLPLFYSDNNLTLKPPAATHQFIATSCPARCVSFVSTLCACKYCR